jgi:cell division protein FtsI (penicillin-binding protein 3)
VRGIEQRVGLVFAAFLLVFAVVLARAVWLQGIRGGELAADAQSQQTESVLVPGKRGRILDRRGRELAVSEESATVYATPYQLRDPAETARQLSEVLDVPEAEILDAVSDRESGFAYVARSVDLAAADEVRELEIEGVGTLPSSHRVYPMGDELAGQVLGAVGLENQGLSGLEIHYDEALAGADGEAHVTRDALGETIRRETVDGESAGEDIRLTLDAEVQATTEEVLAEIGLTYDPAGATAVVMDPRSSDVLAIANWPPVDLTDLSDAAPDQLTNLATGFTYEPGSTYKAFTVAAALEDGLVTPQTSFYLPPEIKVADRVIEESHPRPAVDMTVASILAQSSNVGAVKIGLDVGAERFDQYIRKFGFGEPTGIELPAEERGIVPALEDYSGSTMGNLPIGQGLSVTPMQMAAAYAAIANGGVLRQPRLVREVAGEPIPHPPGTRVMSEDTAAQLRQMLEGVLAPGGTAEEVSVPGYRLAGKTGTAEKANESGYSNSRFVASFAGFAPVDDPGLLAVIVVDEPKGSYYGGEVAAPGFAPIAEFSLPYLGIPPD